MKKCVNVLSWLSVMTISLCVGCAAIYVGALVCNCLIDALCVTGWWCLALVPVLIIVALATAGFFFLGLRKFEQPYYQQEVLTMQKSSFNYKGVDYIVRTLDVTSIPTFEDEAYKCVQVSESALREVLDLDFCNDEDTVESIDNTIFFYADSDFMRTDPSDEELLSYLRESLP